MGASASILLASRRYMNGRANVPTIVAIAAASRAVRPWRRRQAPESTEGPWATRPGSARELDGCVARAAGTRAAPTPPAPRDTALKRGSLVLRRLIPIAGVGLWMAACGAGASTPTGPSANVPSANVTVQITPQPDVLLAGTSVALTARNASTGAVVEPSWSTSDSTVAVVSLGQLRALHAGVATIGAVLGGSTNTFVVRVVPDYAGTYDGTMFIAECTNGAAPTFCRGFSRTGRFVARLTQAKDLVSGTLSVFGSAPGPIEGRIDTAGRLTVTGRLGNPAGVFIDLESWSTFLTDAGTQMYGTFTMQEMDGDVHRGSMRAELPGIDRTP